MCIYINWAAPAIDILFVCLWTTLRCVYINWAAPTIDILFVCLWTTFRCVYINWVAPTNDILFVWRLPSDEYQLGRSDN